MDTRKLIAAAPWIRKAWRVVPGPLRIPLLAIAFVVWLVRRGDDDATDPGATPTG